ncbi:hypothetical protein [Paenirhodobacter enshiensis]|uniref:hypothetical protein n=1 Tax=Paenirhodobacter enshiensis TaxID=1105367 RepID=UPI0035AF2EF7
MADCIFTPPIRFPEAAASFTPTPLTQHFTAVLHDLSAFIVAEHDLELCGSCDPACDAWITDAESARTRVLDSLSHLLATRVTRGEELPLRHCGIIAHNIITCDNAHDFHKAASLSQRFPHFFDSSGEAELAGHVNLMITQFRALFSKLVDLAEIADPLDAEYTDALPIETKFMMVAAA